MELPSLVVEFPEEIDLKKKKLIKERGSVQSFELQKCQPRNEIKNYGAKQNNSMQQGVQPHS